MTSAFATSLPSVERPWIKVCGVRTGTDLEACALAGATHVGFNTWPWSPRRVEPERVGGLVEAARACGLVPVVLSVPRSPLDDEGAARLGVWLQSASPVAGDLREQFLGLVESRAAREGSISAVPWGDALLLDAHAEGLPGGTGKEVDLGLALRAPRPFILAGGLNPDAVAAAVAAVAPAGVDAASGLESSPGVKDAGRIRAFCAAAREAFEELQQKSPVHRRDAEGAERTRWGKAG